MPKLFAAAAVLCVLSAGSFASAQEVTLRAASGFTENTEFSRNFERFVEKVNKDGKGQIQINYIGGPRAIPPFEIGNAVRSRVIDIANAPGAFYANIMPEAEALKLLSKPMKEQRANGTWEALNQIHNQKVNSWFLARQLHNLQYHIYSNKKIDKPDFTGLKIRVTPVYRDLVQALGGTPITTPPAEVYTALERGVVDGYGWPLTGIFEFGLQKVTKYRLEPGIYSVDVNVLVNLDTWKSLTDAQRRILSDAALWLEALDSEKEADIKRETEQQNGSGIAPLVFNADDAARFVSTANEAAWTSILKRAPEGGARLKALAGQ